MKIKTVIMAISLVILFSILGVLTYFTFFKTEIQPRENKEETKINEISGYAITSDENDSEVYKSEFENLKKILESDTIDYEEYAKTLAKLYIIDLYTINNKINKYDVGGVEFVYEKAKENYITNVTDTLYKYVKDNSDNKRDQKLPEVKEINIDEITNTTYKIEDTNYEGYKIKLSWDYIEDLGYDKFAEVIVIKEENKIFVVEENTK